MVSIIAGSSGASERSVGSASSLSTTALESSSATSPKMVWWPFSHSVGTVVMKNWEQLVPCTSPVHGSAGAVAERAAALDHEVLDDAVEGQTVVERIVAFLAGKRVGPFFLAGGQTDKVGHRLRRLVVEQVDFDVTFRGAHDNGSHGPKCLMGLRPWALLPSSSFSSEWAVV